MASIFGEIVVRPVRLMTAAEAAHYCRRSPKRFLAECPVAPILMANGDAHYDVQDVDTWIDSLKELGRHDDIIARLE